MRKTKLVLVGLALLLFASPMAAGLVIQGHSPITILLTDPQGNEFGCTSATCSPPSTNFVDALPLSECSISPSTTDSCTYQLASSGGVTNITIPNPMQGAWGVQYFGTGTGSFNIVLLNCPEAGSGTNDAGNPNQGHYEPGCGKGSKGVINGVATTGAQSICDQSSIYYSLHVCDPDDNGYFLITSGTLTNNNACTTGCGFSVNYNTDGSLALGDVVKSVSIFGPSPSPAVAGTYAQFQGTVTVQPGSIGTGLPVHWYLDGVNVYNTTTAQKTAPNTYYFNFGEGFTAGPHSIYAVCGGVQSNVISFDVSSS